MQKICRKYLTSGRKCDMMCTVRFRRRDKTFEARELFEFQIPEQKLKELERFERRVVKELDDYLGKFRTRILNELWKTYEERYEND